MDSLILVGKILQKFKDRGSVEVDGYNTFTYINETQNSVLVGRENGADTPIPFEKIKLGVEAFQSNTDLYTQGPSKLREFGITHISSPIWSMLHLLEVNDYL